MKRVTDEVGGGMGGREPWQPLTETTMLDEPMWTQREAAAFVRLSPSTLRASDCPKRLIYLPGRTRPIVRYAPREVRAWLTARSTAA